VNTASAATREPPCTTAQRGEIAVALPMRHAGVQAVALRYEL